MRRKSFAGVLTSIAREAARAQKRAETQQRQLLREHERHARYESRLENQRIREEKQQYLEERQEYVYELNEALEDTIKELDGILDHTLSIDDTINFESLFKTDSYPDFVIPASLSSSISTPNAYKFISSVKKLNWFTGLFPSFIDKYNKEIKIAEERYHAAVLDAENKEDARKNEITKLKEEHELKKQEFIKSRDTENKEIEEFKKAYFENDREAILAYNTMVLERSEYPVNFPQEFKVTYSVDSKELVIDYELPNKDIIPAVQEFKYIKSRDLIDKKPKKAKEIADIYADLICSIALRTIHEIFEADQNDSVQVVTFNGFKKAVDKSTGKDIAPFIISIRVTKAAFVELNLKNIDKQVCIRNLGARVSPSPAELIAVKPIVEFDMVDKRFVDQDNIIDSLDNRPNLMELSPTEFEVLVSNLFTKMGLETKLTRTSRDGGVDAIAFDKRPVLGGKVVIQAKRYRHTVGVSAVRDLYGTMQHEGANKGILVSTSGYGPDAFEFAKDKPIELIDGGNLLYLLGQVNINARIIMPIEN
jgi:restriction system protein